MMRTLAGVSSARTPLMADSSYSWVTLCSASSRSLHADQTTSDLITPDHTRSYQIRADQTRCVNNVAEQINGVPNAVNA